MIRKTVALKDTIYNELDISGIIASHSNFSDIVNQALESYIKEIKREQYKQAIAEAKNDKLFLEDVAQVSEDFKYSDGEVGAF